MRRLRKLSPPSLAPSTTTPRSIDPLSLTASILAITTACLKSAHLLDGLREKYKHAQITISALCAEATVISASLSQIQSLILGNPGAVITQLRPRSEVIATFDAALTGCSVVFAVLDDEIASLVVEGEEDGLSWSQRAKIVWKDAVMKELLQQLRGQTAAIGLLIQALQIESISGIKDLLQHNSLLLDHVLRQTRSLRESHPKVIAPRSIFDSHREEIGSMVGTENTGLSESTFVFDDLVVDSKVYRRVLAQARSKLSLNEEKQEASEPEPEPEPEIEKVEATSIRPTTFYDYIKGSVLNIEMDATFQRTLEETMSDIDFKDELSAIEQWFSVLSTNERKASLYGVMLVSLSQDVEKPPRTVAALDSPKSFSTRRYGWMNREEMDV